MKIVMSHPTGNSNVRAVIAALDKAALLAEFNTTVAANPESAWLKLIPKGIRDQLLRRTFPITSDRLFTHPCLELTRMILPKIGLAKFVQNEHSWASLDSVYRDFDKSVAGRLKHLVKKKGITAVYGYEDGALNTFKKANELGLKCIYDLPIAYWETGRKLMLEEAERLPAWAPTLGGGIKDSPEKLERKTRELELADIVLGPGEFVMQSLPTWAKTKQMVMTPFGSPVRIKDMGRRFNFYDDNFRLRVLFVGSMSQRKGLGDLFSAIRLLNRSDIDLVIMGSLMVPIEFYQKELPEFTYLPNRPHEQVLSLMRSCDVFCLPSIVEGRALVMQEAMSQGLPLIITPNTGGEDLIIDGRTGFLVPIRSPEAIAEKLNWFLENRSKIPAMGKMAQRHAAKYSWEVYGSKIVSALSDFLN
ncbi:MAG: group 1 glycosyl transferase [Mucilaginibacter sp.]|nr:group 1 glycosyl transferase [Mucilaginibacter sp.]